jgi:DNA polymerase elongation subunit (family B)
MRDILIFGKNDLERIVSIEVVNDAATVFQEWPDGEVTSQILPNRFWLLVSRPLPGWHKLDGNLHYGWGRQYLDREEWFQDKRYLTSQGIDVYSIYDPRESLMVKDGMTYHKGMRTNDVSVLSFDIETTGLDPKAPDAKVLIISNTFRGVNGKIIRRMFTYDDYIGEDIMIQNWCTWVREINPSIICGHNIISYDLPYLTSIASEYNIELKLGRDKSPIKLESYESKFRKDQAMDLHYHKCRIYGREVVDTMFLAIKYDQVAKKYESYALKKIIAQEGWEVKGRQHYDASKIRENYQDPIEWVKIKNYAEFDSDDSLTLYDKMIPPLFYLAQSVPKSFQALTESASGSQINSMMIRSYLQEGHSIPKSNAIIQYQGAISFGIPGKYSNVFKVDVRSLYPSIMLTYDIFDKNKDPHDNLKKMLQYFTNRRIEYKKLAKETGDTYYIHLDAVSKIFANSVYGFYNAMLNFNYPEGAAKITETGRDILGKAINWATSRPITDFVFEDVRVEENA